MKQEIFNIGEQYEGEEYLAQMKFTLEDLLWLQSLISRRDHFYKEISKGIDILQSQSI